MARDELLQQGLDHILSTACRQPFQTDAGVLVRCGSRLKSVCPGCSAIHVGDWQAIIRSGVFEAGPDYLFYLLTLTAPSFGPVHFVPKAASSRPCVCGEWHQPKSDGHLRGIPIDPGSYSYAEQIDWNATSSRLWDATRSRLRALAPSLEFASVREWQARGALHLHLLLRVHSVDMPAISVTAIESVVHRVTARSDRGAIMQWGANVDCRVVKADQTTGRAIWYLTKAVGYLTKDVADGGGGASLECNEHWAWLDRAAQDYRCRTCSKESRQHCGGKLHRQWGARSHVVSVSRRSRDGLRSGWSLTGLTRTAQRQQRREWAEAHFGTSESCI